MKIEIAGDALELLKDFIFCSKRDPIAVSDAIHYDIVGFMHQIKQLEKAMEAGTQ